MVSNIINDECQGLHEAQTAEAEAGLRESGKQNEDNVWTVENIPKAHLNTSD